MNKNFFYECIQNKNLFSAMLAFNIRQKKDSPAKEWEKLIDSRFFGEGFYEKYSAPPKTFWNFADETKRLALADPATIKKLALYIGAGIHAAEISRLLEKNSVLAIRQATGKDVCLYALERGKFQASVLKKIFSELDRELSLSEKISLHGQKALCLCTASWEEELKDIFCQNLAKTLPDMRRHMDSPVPIAQEQTKTVWNSVKKLLVQEVDPLWRPYFN